MKTPTDLEFSIFAPAAAAVKRLDLYIARMLDESRVNVKKWFKQDGVLSGDTVLKPSVTPAHQTRVTIRGYLRPALRRVEPNAALDIPVIYEDDEIIVMNKPRGIAVNAIRHDETQTVANFLLARAPRIAAWDSRPLEPGIVHRLDQWTSGCLIGVKTEAALSNIQAQFRNRRVRKFYFALVEGHVAAPATWVDYLIHDPREPRKMCCLAAPEDAPVPSRARRARLSLRPIRQCGPVTLVEVRLHTGRMHQIRAQCAARNLPLVGDRIYGARLPTSLHQQWLHAHELSFFHPRTHARLFFRAPIPPDLVRVTVSDARVFSE